MQLRDDKPEIPFRNMWCFPGGAIEIGETIEDCLVREIREEAEINVDRETCVPVLTYEHDTTTDYVFFCVMKHDQEPTVHEGQTMKWMDYAQIQKLPLAWQQDKLMPLVGNLVQTYCRGLAARHISF